MKNLSTSFFVFAALQVITLCASLLMSGIGLGGLMGAESNSDINFGTNLASYGLAFAVLSIVLLIFALIAGFGVRGEKGWGRVTGIITAIISLVEFPIGTGFGIYWLIKLFKK